MNFQREKCEGPSHSSPAHPSIRVTSPNIIQPSPLPTILHQLKSDHIPPLLRTLLWLTTHSELSKNKKNAGELGFQTTSKV